MRIAIDQPRFLKSLQMVERAINDRSTLPILAHILLEAQGNHLILTATDLDVGVRYQLPLTTQPEQGAVTLPARRLSAIIRELPEEPINLEVRKNHVTTLTCGQSHFRLPGLPPEDFPIFPTIEQQAVFTTTQTTLKNLVTQTAFAMSIEETRFVLNGTLFRIHNSILSLVATDGRRLAIASTKEIKAPQEALAAIVPAKTVRELGRLLQDEEDDPVSIAPLKDNQLLFQFGEATIMTRLVEGQFPQYESVIPPPSPITVRCSRQRLMSAIRRVSLMTTATSQAVIFELAKDRIVISKESPELGSAREELPALYTGEPMTIAFNPEFWLDVLNVLEADEVTIEVTAPEKPAIIRLPQLLYIVLPMKLAS